MFEDHCLPGMAALAVFLSPLLAVAGIAATVLAACS